MKRSVHAVHTLMTATATATSWSLANASLNSRTMPSDALPVSAVTEDQAFSWILLHTSVIEFLCQSRQQQHEPSPDAALRDEGSASPHQTLEL